ncbi:hypothetical protein MJO47_10780 [Desulfuromonas sp. KJ2020]|uniref:hypothetical protein n=1 Tax=Desulfuromonas sp. KJ2020 TaxID=2919173 RepID=UPI0020A82533|nr:hypothetical protein [Desulfuromonas sp. KJ2020]MCP3177586.1 hypothetical protein [Desulfuromonas sp. KJ2020]
MPINVRRFYFAFLFFACVAFIFQLFFHKPSFNWTDLPAWKNDYTNLLCHWSGTHNCKPLSKFPFAYLINSFFLSITPKTHVIITTTINLIFLIFSAFFVDYVSKINTVRSTSFFYIIALIFSVIPSFYINSGALEVQYGVVLGVFCSSFYIVLFKNKNKKFIFCALFISTFMLPLYKDTSAIFIGIVYLIGIIIKSKNKTLISFFKTSYEHLNIIKILISSLTPSILITLWYNWHRYYSLLPIPYLIEAREAAPPYVIKALYFFWIFFSPNGGLLVSWAASLIVLLLLLFSVGHRPSFFGLLASLGLIVSSSIILANWWTPFGWEGWGNRLIIPSAIASLILISSTAIPKTKNLQSDGNCLFYRKSIFAYLKMGLVVTVFIPSFLYIALSYSGNRYIYLQESLWGSAACKAVEQLRDKRPMWEFKKTPVHLECHLDRFRYIPGISVVQDISPLTIIDNTKYEIGSGSGPDIFGPGWSHVEEWGVWSDGPNAEIRFIPGYSIQKIIFELQPFVYGNVKSQRLIIYQDGVPLYSGTLTKPQNVVIYLPECYAFEPNDILNLYFEIPDAISPAKVGLNRDKRKLGIGLKSIEFR